LPVPEGFDGLSVADKLRFLAELWDRTESTKDAADLHDRVVGQVARARLEELRENPGMAILNRSGSSERGFGRVQDSVFRWLVVAVSRGSQLR
jgi:hypothetical protein